MMPRGRAPLTALTPQHIKSLRLAGEGLTVTDIARRLWLAEPTVKFHRRTVQQLARHMETKHPGFVADAARPPTA